MAYVKISKWEIPLLRSIIFSGFHFDEVWANLDGDRLEGPIYEGSILKSSSLVFKRNNLFTISRIYELWERLTTWFYKFLIPNLGFSRIFDNYNEIRERVKYLAIFLLFPLGYNSSVLLQLFFSTKLPMLETLLTSSSHVFTNSVPTNLRFFSKNLLYFLKCPFC